LIVFAGRSTSGGCGSLTIRGSIDLLEEMGRKLVRLDGETAISGI
jgi:hypothetical protein